jgi:transposase
VDDKTLYQTILGLGAPWYVDRVEILGTEQTVLVHIARQEGSPLVCPECGETGSGYDLAEERRWRHLDTCQYATVLSARIPRVQCRTHGVRQVRVPWAEERSRFTALFEAFALRVLEETTVLGLSRLLRISWHEASGILRRAVARGLARRTLEPVRFYGVDETSFQKRHEYVTVVSDLERARVLAVLDHRREESLGEFWGRLTETQRAEVEDVVMDMWDPYIAATRETVPGGLSKITFDRFHVMWHLNRAVDLVRRAEHAELRRAGDQRLKGTKYIWLRGGKRRRRRELLRIQELRRSGLKVGRAWAIKEAIAKLWRYRSATWARRFFARWYGWAVRSQLPAMATAARTLKSYLYGILGYLRYQHTNALAESLNAKIQELKYRARGYRNRQNFRLAILFHCGGLDMNPR